MRSVKVKVTFSVCPLSGAAGVPPRQDACSYLVYILRYAVHLVGPGHPCRSVSHNHRLFPLEWELFPWALVWRCLRERDELVRPWDPCFYRKVLRCAHTGSVSRCLSVGAQRRTHFKKDVDAFKDRGKPWNYDWAAPEDPVEKMNVTKRYLQWTRQIVKE